MSVNSRSAPQIAEGAAGAFDVHSHELISAQKHKRLGRARQRGGEGVRTSFSLAVLGRIDWITRERQLIEANTGPCKVLMRDGVWLVPEDQRPR